MVVADHTFTDRRVLHNHLTGQVKTPTGQHCNQRRHHQRRCQRNVGRQRLGNSTKHPHKTHHPDHRCQHHRTKSHRIDVVQVSPLELNVFGTQTQGLVDHQIGNQRPDPGHCNVGINPQNPLQRFIHPQHHQQQRDDHIKDQPHHPARVAVGQAGKEIRPGNGTGIRVGDIDLDLTQHHKQAGQSQVRHR